MPRRRNNRNFGTVSIGATDEPTPVKPEKATPTEEERKELEEKVAKYRSENLEKPKDTTPLLQTPLAIKRAAPGSMDSEYIALAKRYLGMLDGMQPTVADMAKAVIRLFEDNAKMYAKLKELAGCQGGVSARPKRSYEHSGSWN